MTRGARPSLTRAMVAHARAATAALLDSASPADQVLSRYFRAHRQLGQRERAFIAEAAFAVLRRKRSLEALAGSAEPGALLLAALVRVLGYSGRVLNEALDAEELAFVARVRAAKPELAGAVLADLPDWLWERLMAQEGEVEAARVAQGLLNAAPLDLRVNLARVSRDEALAGLAEHGLQGAPTPYSPAGVRLRGKPALNREPLFLQGLVEVQDEGSQLLTYLLAPRRGEMVADFCAGAGGKTLACAALMRGTGRVYAMDTSAPRLAALAPRMARAQVGSVHPMLLAGDNDARLKRLAGKFDRVLVDAPCTGLGTLRRNPDLKWRHGPGAVAELAAKQGKILASAARLVRPGGRLLYATCSLLQEENEAVAEQFLRQQVEFAPLDCGALLRAQHLPLESGPQLRLWPHRHGTDGFFAAAFERRG